MKTKQEQKIEPENSTPNCNHSGGGYGHGKHMFCADCGEDVRPKPQENN